MKRTLLFALSLALVLAVVACGDSTEDGNAPDDGGPTTIEAVASDDFRFRPDAWSVTANEEVVIDLTNSGTIEHTWALLTAEISSEDEFDRSLVLVELKAAGGVEVQGGFPAPAAGSYQVICTIAGHFDAGMVGLLQVGD